MIVSKLFSKIAGKQIAEDMVSYLCVQVHIITYMSKNCFDSSVRLSKASKTYLDKVNEIIDDFDKMGHKLTLRQLYYQLVGKAIIENETSSYRKLSTLLTDGRMSGFVDWDIFEDRLRKPQIPYCSSGIAEALEMTANIYKIDRMEGQQNYIEVWVEKDALSGILSKITREYHINLMVNRGFSSSTAMHEAYTRFAAQIEEGQKCVILYIGDHDPSGICMHEDIENRLKTFGLNNIEVKRIALNIEQVHEYNLPENKLKKDDKGKLKDPRGVAYNNKYGDKSWEVDALSPMVLDQIVRDEIESLINRDQYLAMLETEREERTTLLEIAQGYAEAMF
jgi:hypothetical protein